LFVIGHEDAGDASGTELNSIGKLNFRLLRIGSLVRPLHCVSGLNHGVKPQSDLHHVFLRAFAEGFAVWHYVLETDFCCLQIDLLKSENARLFHRNKLPLNGIRFSPAVELTDVRGPIDHSRQISPLDADCNAARSPGAPPQARRGSAEFNLPRRHLEKEQHLRAAILAIADEAQVMLAFPVHRPWRPNWVAAAWHPSRRTPYVV
jgi:hypothetical protein